MAKFEPLTVPLKGGNIVEASAGTGKTYSIGLLVLRLLIEKKIPIKKILLVTFTNAAVAELASRIRVFISKAIKVAEGEGICKVDKDIKTIVEKYKDDQTNFLLKMALLELDEASIQTIHSFCQESLNNYALDSGQAYGLELEPDISILVDTQIKGWWRKNVPLLEEEDLKEWNNFLKVDILRALVQENLKGKVYSGNFSSEVWEMQHYHIKRSELLEVCHKDIVSILKQFDETEFTERYLKGKNKPKARKNIESPDKLYSFLFGDDKGYKGELFNELLIKYRKDALLIKGNREDIIHKFFWRALKEIKAQLDSELTNKSRITYNHLIQFMHTAVLDDGKESFKNILREKYEAIFIDEFQDTDKFQYEIYDKLFGKDKILFYIGDPKQSIYAWRKADLHTYFQAKGNIPKERQYEMDKNYRSSTAYINSVEEFYSRCKDSFHTAESELDLSYLPVMAHNKKAIGLKKEAKELNALQIFDGGTKSQIKIKVQKLVNELLNGGYVLNGEKVENSDIGILVRTNNEAAQIKNLLAGAGIHAITIDDSQVFQDSQEAKSLLYILQAVLTPTEGHINKAILNSFTGYNAKQTAERSKEDLLDVFRSYREIWNEAGVYPMLKKYMNDFGVMKHLLETSDSNGLRILTNLTQILELLQESEYRQELKPLGLYQYLSKQIAGELQEGDEYQQRMESDEAAVKIVTIHKAKGLEYPIVIAPFMDLKTNETKFIKTYAFRESGLEGQYKFYCKGLGNDEQRELAKNQWEQENRRLLYVALTRAKFNCFVFKNTGERIGNTCLTPFTKGIGYDVLDSLDLPLPPIEELNKLNKNNLHEDWGNSLAIPIKKLSDHLQGNLSFSGISAHGTYIPKEKDSKIENDYDQFIFKDIPRGTVIGDMLHLLFENMDFTGSEEHHREELEKLLDRFYPHKKEEYLDGLLKMINQVLNANIEIKGQKISLNQIANSSKKNEMEFDFRTQGVHLPGLKDFEAGEKIEIGYNTQHPAKSGMLNGFIDLLFKHEGKFYILDWKSNFLGDHLDNYATSKMTEAMNEGNYHLQYFIYSMAVKNYLEQRLPKFDYKRDFGGVIYVYLRGARAGKNTGVYTSKPTLEQVEKLESVFNQNAV